MAWAPFGVDGRSADGLQPPHRAAMAVCGNPDARDGERIRSRELSRTGLARVGGDVGAVAAGCRRRQAGNGMARPAPPHDRQIRGAGAGQTHPVDMAGNSPVYSHGCKSPQSP